VNEEKDICNQLVRIDSFVQFKPDSLSLEAPSKLVDCTNCIDISLEGLGLVPNLLIADVPRSCHRELR